MPVKPVPEGFHTVTPYLFIKGAAEAIEYYKAVFNAAVPVRMPGPDGRIMHAELRIGDSTVMLGEENPKIGALSPRSIGGAGFTLNVYLDNVDAVVKKAVEKGAKLQRPVQDQFYGDRTGTVVDPFGHMWTIATHVEDVAPDEMRRRMAAIGQAAGA